MSRVSLTAVICTHDRPDDLRRCLDAFAILDDPVEVIVVDSASTPPCRGLVEEYASSIPGLTYLREDAPGLARARNRGRTGGDRGHRGIRRRRRRTPLPLGAQDRRAVQRPQRRVRWRLVPSRSSRTASARAGCQTACCNSPASHGSRRPARHARAPNGPSAPTSPSAARHSRLRAASRSTSAGPAPHCCRVRSRRRSRPCATRAGESSSTRTRPSTTLYPASRCVSRYYWQRLWWAGVTRARMRRGRGRTLARLLAAAPLRVCLYVVTLDRVYLYRLAETAGFLRDLATPRPSR